MIVASSSTSRYTSGLIRCVSDCRHGIGATTLHQPSREIGAIAAKVKKSTCSVELGIRKPSEKLWRDVDLLWTFVAIVHHNLAEFAKCVLPYQLICCVVAGIPDRLVVDEHVNSSLRGRLLDSPSVCKTHRKSFSIIT